MSSRPGAGGPKLRRLNMGQVFIILAVVSAVLTIFVFKSLMSNKPVAKVEEVKTRPLVVASSQIFPGETIDSNNIKVLDWPEKFYPKEDVYDKSNAIMGRAVKTMIFEGSPVFKQSLAGENTRGGLPMVIPEGYRAVTVLVSENRGAGGFIKPGDWVDVVGTFQYSYNTDSIMKIARAGFLTEKKLYTTQTVLQDVQVLAIAQNFFDKKTLIEEGLKDAEEAKDKDKDKDDKDKKKKKEEKKGGGLFGKGGDSGSPYAKIVSSVTLAVTPDQAEKLLFADTRAEELRLSLRPENEHGEVEIANTFGSGGIFGSVSLSSVLDKLGERAASAAMQSFPNLLTKGGELPPIEDGDGIFDIGKLDDDTPPPPPVADLPPAPIVMPATYSVEIIEGTTKSSVSF